MPDEDDVIVDEEATPTFEVPSLPVFHKEDGVSFGEFKEEGERPAPKKRGRPRKTELPLPNITTNVTGRTAKELSVRGQAILQGISAVPALWKPHFLMTDDEAKSIMDPLSSYLVRQAEYNEVISEFIDRWDLVAFLVAMVAYMTRVVRDEIKVREENNAAKPRRPRVALVPGAGMGEPREEVSGSQGEFNGQPSTPNDGSDLSSPIDERIYPISAPPSGQL